MSGAWHSAQPLAHAAFLCAPLWLSNVVGQKAPFPDTSKPTMWIEGGAAGECVRVSFRKKHVNSVVDPLGPLVKCSAQSLSISAGLQLVRVIILDKSTRWTPWDPLAVS